MKVTNLLRLQSFYAKEVNQVVVVLKKEVKMDFETAVKHVENAVTGADMSILLTKSIDAILRKKLGVMEYPRYTIVLACAPH